MEKIKKEQKGKLDGIGRWGDSEMRNIF